MSFPRYPEYKDSGVEWLGAVPRHWRVLRIKHLLKSLEQGWSPQCEAIPVDSPDEWGVLKVGCVNGGVFNAAENKALPPELEPIPDLGIRAADLLISRANTRELVGSAAVALVDHSNLMLCDKLFRLRFDASVCSPHFIASYLSTGKVRGQIELAASGASSSMLNIGQSTILEMAVALPDSTEQVAICDFLRRETTKIDKLMAEQEKLIALLKEKRQAVISHAVTKGLDPAVPLKDSGVEWLGEVPAHWTVISLGRATQEKCDGPFGSGLKSEHYKESGVRVIRLQNIRQDGFDGSDEAFIDAEYYQGALAGRDVVAGDVLIAGLGDERNTVGRACVAPDDIAPAMVKADCFRFRLFTEIAVPAFVARQLSVSSSADAGAFATGTTRSRIPLTVMATRKVSLPPAKEQQEIVSWIEQEMAKLDALCAECEQAIELLKERRTALISAAVTGQIDVRGLVKEGQEQAA